MNSFEKINIPRVDITEQELSEYSDKRLLLHRKSRDLDRVAPVYDQIFFFSLKLKQAYEDGLLAENPSRSALYHVLTGSSDPDNKENWEKFDYEGDYSIRKFIDDQLASLTE